MPPPRIALVLKRLELAEEIRAKLDAGKMPPRMKTLKAFGVRITPKLKKLIQSANRLDRLIRAMQAQGMHRRGPSVQVRIFAQSFSPENRPGSAADPIRCEPALD